VPVTQTPAPRSEDEAREILAAELDGLSERADALGEAGAQAVAAWSLQMAYEFEAAQMAWARTVELEPHNAQARFNEGVCLLEVESLEAAEQAFRHALEIDAAVTEGEPGEGLDWFEEDPHFKLGNVQHLRGDLEAACVHYARSAQRNLTAVEALTELIRCRLALGQAEKALEAIDRLTTRAARLSVRAEAEAYRAEARALLSAAAESESEAGS